MYLDIIKYLLVFIGWLIGASYQLDCLQCTSPIRRVSQSWDHSCLDGTLMPLPCRKPINESEAPYKQCVSSIYRVGARGIAGVLIQRGCTTSNLIIQNDCDPPGVVIDFRKTENFYCTHTCLNDGCNRHSVEEITISYLAEDITSNANKLLLKNKFLLLYFIFFICNYLFS